MMGRKIGRQRRGTKLLALILGFSLIAAACGDDDDDDAGTEGEQQAGGDLVIGAEQWAECLNVMTQCSNASWMHYTTAMHVLPRLMEATPEGEYVPSPVLDGEPELSGEGTDNGDGLFTVTYKIAEDAVWDDGTPITSKDIKFTWQARMETTGSVSTTGYEEIDDIDDSDDKTAVVTFTKPYAAWKNVFGGVSEYVIKADEFDQTDVADEMTEEIPFSGGPWILESWSPEEAVLARNEKYWDKERTPLADTVTFIPFEDTDAELTALQTGDVMALHPQPTPGIVDALGDKSYEVNFTETYEELWLNQASEKNTDTVLKDPAVREALMYAVNRQKLLEEIVQPEIPEAELLHCSFWVPTTGDWCDMEDFADVEYDPDKAATILEDAGYVKGDDGIYAKDGKRLSMTFQTVADNKRRTDIQNVLIPELKEFGIELTTDNTDAGTLFEQWVPQMQTEVALYAQVTNPDPTVTQTAHCDQISSPENEFSGQNQIGWCNEEASELMTKADQTVDEAERLDLIHQIGDIARGDVPSIPLWQLPQLVAWDPDLVEGPIDEYLSTSYSPFFNMFDWSLK